MATEKTKWQTVYRRAIAICHPDRSPEHLRPFLEEKAKALNAAMTKGDFATIRQIAAELGVKNIPPLPESSPPPPKFSPPPPQSSPPPRQAESSRREYRRQPNTSSPPKWQVLFARYKAHLKFRLDTDDAVSLPVLFFWPSLCFILPFWLMVGDVVFGDGRCMGVFCEYYINPWAWAAGHCIIYALSLNMSEWVRLAAVAVYELLLILLGIVFLIIFVEWVVG